MTPRQFVSMMPYTEPGIFICSEKFKKPRKRKRKTKRKENHRPSRFCRKPRNQSRRVPVLLRGDAGACTGAHWATVATRGEQAEEDEAPPRALAHRFKLPAAAAAAAAASSPWRTPRAEARRGAPPEAAPPGVRRRALRELYAGAPRLKQHHRKYGGRRRSTPGCPA